MMCMCKRITQCWRLGEHILFSHNSHLIFSEMEWLLSGKSKLPITAFSSSALQGSGFTARISSRLEAARVGHTFWRIEGLPWVFLPPQNIAPMLHLANISCIQKIILYKRQTALPTPTKGLEMKPVYLSACGPALWLQHSCSSQHEVSQEENLADSASSPPTCPGLAVNWASLSLPSGLIMVLTIHSCFKKGLIYWPDYKVTA